MARYPLAFFSPSRLPVLTGLFGFAAAGAEGYGRPGLRAGGESFWPELLTTIFITLGLLLTPFFPPLLLLIVIVLVAWLAIERRRHAQRSVFLATLAAAVERQIPPAPILDALAREQRGKIGWQIAAVADRLRAGGSLLEALEGAPGLMTPEGMLSLRMAGGSAALPPALRDAMAIRESDESHWLETAGRFLYLIMKMFFIWALIAFMMWKVLPHFPKVFDEYGGDLPRLTTVASSVSGLFVTYWYVLVMVLLGLAFLTVYSFLRYTGLIRWQLPLVSRLWRRLDTAAILENLALATEQNRPMADAIALLAAGYPQRKTRLRLELLRRDVERGESWSTSIARRGLIGHTELAVLQAASRVGNLPWAMREMADSIRRRLDYRLRGWLHVLFVAMVLSLGVLVGLVTVSFFMPLISLIQKLS